MTSKISYKSSVEHDLKKLDKPVAGRLLTQLERTLSADPNAGEPLRGEFRGLFKYRIGNYRVIYAKISGGVLVVRVRHRRESYR